MPPGRDLALSLLVLACLALLTNLAPREATEPRPGLFPPGALAVPPGDDQEFADLSLSDLLLGLAQTPHLDPTQREAIRSQLPAIRARLQDPQPRGEVEIALTRALHRQHLLDFQKIRKRSLGRPRDDAANLAAVEAHVAR